MSALCQSQRADAIALWSRPSMDAGGDSRLLAEYNEYYLVAGRCLAAVAIPISRGPAHKSKRPPEGGLC